MWSKDNEDTITDEDGNIVYFGIERFVRDICLGDCCFICGAPRDSVPFNDEHILPQWVLGRYDLHARTINLPNGTSFRYDRYTIPCCESCNTLMGRTLEEPMRALVEGGNSAIFGHQENTGHLLFYVWVGLIFLKLHLKDRRLRANRDLRKSAATISEDLEYNWQGLHYLHTLVRCFATGTVIDPSALGSFVCIRVQEDLSAKSFDLADLYDAQAIMVRIDGFAFLAAFNDARGSGLFLKQKLDRVTGPVSSLQLRELFAELCFLNLHLKEHPPIQSGFSLDDELHAMKGEIIVPELHELDYGVRAHLHEYYFRDQIGKIKNYQFSDAEIVAMIKSGRMTFLFDRNGRFFETSVAEPPANFTRSEEP
ncbi:hypothetical protein GA0061098_10343 [Bradyrhizobium shewense]|uniref:HNH endonuclease n=1 Tax=Bradyrhizobium shewense TaxID=1761772 RepID=A0A1C3XRY9_9BRAD|nr:hypothetical protein [Bradyrhizobium shewense]SCB55029.1 hypothetical protein GA0061098_10343 [Bradyrhizobium shewense]